MSKKYERSLVLIFYSNIVLLKFSLIEHKYNFTFHYNWFY